jgi:hypothetical protein
MTMRGAIVTTVAATLLAGVGGLLVLWVWLAAALSGQATSIAAFVGEEAFVLALYVPMLGLVVRLGIGLESHGTR